MSVKHIENLTVTNFKCFKHLEVMNIGRVNLIGGKNNVGKTAFLEAVELLVLPNKAYELASTIDDILKRRQHPRYKESVEIDFFYDNESKIVLLSDSKNCSIKLSFGVFNNTQSTIFPETDNALPTEILTTSVNNDQKDMPLRRLLTRPALLNDMETRNYRIYISSSKSDEKDIAISYGALINLGREGFLNSSLSSFDNNISELKQIATERRVILKLKLKNNEQLVLLSSLGEGVNRYIAILCAIWANKDGVLLIDEIENGIHYTNYKKLWEIVFQASLDANCQLFITSHSKECISAFNDVQFEIENCSAQYFEFYRNLKNDLITASALDKDQLRYELTHEGRVRGE